MFHSIRFLSLCLGIGAGINVLPAWKQHAWSEMLDLVAMTLLAIVLWFSVERDSEEMRPPTFGTRALRITLYATILMLLLVSGSGRHFVGESWGCGNVPMAVFATAVLTPFIRSEREARKREALP